MTNVKYLDKDKEFIKQHLDEISGDLHNIDNLVMCYENKEGEFCILTSDGVTDYDLIKLKAHLEEYITYRMIHSNFIDPDE